MTYEIEKGVRLPAGGAAHRQYPFAEMQPNDSFALGTDAGKAASVRVAARRWVLRRGGKVRFSVRKTDGGEYRCWRVV